MKISDAILAFDSSDQPHDVSVDDGVVTRVETVAARRRQHPDVLLPALCHAHIHLDKAFLSTRHNIPSDPFTHPHSVIVPESGGFQEALSLTTMAKRRYTADDLYLRGSQLIASSVRQGVTSMRAFVELDHVTKDLTLKVARRLKHDFAHLIHIQICAFAQEPIFSTKHGEFNCAIMAAALLGYAEDIDVLGTTPYVETSEAASRENIAFAVQMALEHKLHLDFHLEYNLTEYDSLNHFDAVVDCLIENKWPTDDLAPTVVIGHATRLTQAPRADLARLADKIKQSNLPIHFVGLPTSDIYMMGRPDPVVHDGQTEEDMPHHRPRGTLNVPLLIKEYGLNACFAVNNVGNPFTPYGDGDPLALASWGVGLYHAGSSDDSRLLYECVSTRAREAIGLTGKGGRVIGGKDGQVDGSVEEGGKWQAMMLVENENEIELPGPLGADRSTTHIHRMGVPAKLRLSTRDVLWDPPELRLRKLVI